MKPYVPALVVCTASGNLAEALPRIAGWQAKASFDWPLVIVENGGVTDLRPDAGSVVVERTPQWLGSVPAMARAMLAAQMKFGQRAEVIVALHDDVEIDQAGWDAEVLSHFATHPQCGLAGFSGALGLGSSDIYQAPYSSMQLARQDFRSNLREAELHGIRSLEAERVICHDGFSLIGRASWWLYGKSAHGKAKATPWDVMTAAGIVHHCYDSLLGPLGQPLGALHRTRLPGVFAQDDVHRTLGRRLRANDPSEGIVLVASPNVDCRAFGTKHGPHVDPEHALIGGEQVDVVGGAGDAPGRQRRGADRCVWHLMGVEELQHPDKERHRRAAAAAPLGTRRPWARRARRRPSASTRSSPLDRTNRSRSSSPSDNASRMRAPTGISSTRARVRTRRSSATERTTSV